MAKSQTFGDKVGNKKSANSQIKLIWSGRSNKTGALRFNEEMIQVPEGKSADSVVKEILAKKK